jgi:predicted lipoprotein with Yx(FWY)xxD motif
MSRFIMATSTIVLLAGFASACRKGRSEADTLSSAGAIADTPVVATTVVPPGGPPVTIAVSEKDGSVVLADGTGRALYVASSPPTSAAGGDFVPVKGKGISGEPRVKAELIGVTPLPDGSLQVTYAEQPLYTYVGDQAPGDAKGQGKTANGASYSLVDPEGKRTDVKRPVTR